MLNNCNAKTGKQYWDFESRQRGILTYTGLRLTVLVNLNQISYVSYSLVFPTKIMQKYISWTLNTEKESAL